MKQTLFPALLAISLALLSLFSGIRICTTCDDLMEQASHASESEAFLESWKSFSKVAAFITPYDLIRTGDSNCRHYIALIESDADDADIEAAQEVMISSIRQIKRIHSLNWELIF